jgi:hypothetical protein
MATPSKPATHVAYAQQQHRGGRKEWTEVGKGSADEKGGFQAYHNRTAHHWTGHVYYAPKGTPPPEIPSEPKPRRPGDDTDEAGED